MRRLRQLQHHHDVRDVVHNADGRPVLGRGHLRNKQQLHRHGHPSLVLPGAGVCVQFGGGSIKWTCGTNTTTGVNHGNNNCAGNGTATTQNLNACSVAGGGGTATYICTGHSAGHALAALPLSMLAVVAAACTSLVAALL